MRPPATPSLSSRSSGSAIELAELGRAFRRWQTKVLGALAVSFVFLALIGGSIWWFGSTQHRDLQGLSQEATQLQAGRNRPEEAEGFFNDLSLTWSRPGPKRETPLPGS